MYIRFVTEIVDEDSGRRQGLFQALAGLQDDGQLADHENDLYLDTIDWFNNNLKEPLRFRVSRKYHKQNTALSWFKTSAARHIDKMRDLQYLLEAHDIQVTVLTSDRPGYIVYEDPYQVVAEPFRETDT